MKTSPVFNAPLSSLPSHLKQNKKPKDKTHTFLDFSTACQCRLPLANSAQGVGVGGGMGGGVCLRVRAPMEKRVLENSCAYARMHCSLFSFALFMDKIDEAFGVSCGVFLRPVNEI